MIKQTITYEDFDGNKRTEDHWFHLSKVEMTRMNVSAEGGFTKMVDKIIKANDDKRILEVFEDIIAKSYGERSLDGRRFIKDDELTKAFMQTPAYDALFEKLTTDADAAAAFINGIMPQEIKDAAAKA